MADKEWIGGDGAGDQQFDVTRGNNWSGAAVPGVGDDVWINGTSTFKIVGGSFTNNPGSITVADDYLQIIGASGDPLIATAMDGDGDVMFYGKADCYFSTVTAGRVVAETMNRSTTAFNLDSTATIADVYLINGRGNLISGLTVTNLYVNYSKERNAEAFCNVNSGVAITDIDIIAGTCISAISPSGVVYVIGGYCEITSGSPGTIRVAAGQTCKYSGVGTVTLAKVMGSALLDIGGDGQARTIIDAIVFEAGRIEARGANVTFTNPPVLQGRGSIDSSGALSVVHI